MSQKPYVVQEDRPNLVIIPMVTCYEPSSKKRKLDSDVSVQKLPTPSKICSRVFAKKTANLNYSALIANNDNLIDVGKLKKSPTSWASNFLQSIGGSSAKFARPLASASKTSSLRKENTQPKTNEEINLPHSTENTLQLKTNTSSNHIIMDKKSCLPNKPSISINLIRPQNTQNPAHQPKEFSQSNCNSHTNESKKDVTSTKQIQVKKLPTLPKKYKIPIQSKCNIPTVQPATEKEVTGTTNVTKSYPSNSDITRPQSVICLPKTSHASIHPKHNKLVLPSKIQNKEIAYTLPKPDINHIHTNQDKNQLKRQKTIKELNYDKEVDLFLSKVTKVKEIKAPSKNDKNTIEPTLGTNLIQHPENNEAQLKKGKETKESENKAIKKRKTIKECDLPKSYRDPIPERYDKEVTSPKTEEESARSKMNNKKESTYSTKLKTKKVINPSKSKHSEIIRPKDGQSKTEKKNSDIQRKTKKTIKITPTKPPKGSAIKVDFSSKMKKKAATENNTRDGESTDCKNKEHVGIETNATKKEISKAFDVKRSSTSISPIKSVVTKIKGDRNMHSPENRPHKELDHHTHFQKTSFKEYDYQKRNSETALRREPNIDLRSKLKRKFNKKNFYKDDYNCGGHRRTKDKFATVPNTEPFVPKEKLIISFNAKDGNEETIMDKTSPVKKLARKQPPGGKKCKKIKLEINIVFDNADATDEESIKIEDEENDEKLENTDLSFLDDFNVDEIVQSLNECKNSSITANNAANVTVGDAEIQDLIRSRRKIAEAEAMANCLNSDLTTQATDLEPASNMNRSFNHDNTECNIDKAVVIKNDTDADIQKLPALDSSVIKKELDMNQNLEIERTAGLFQCQKTEGCQEVSSESATIKSEISTITDQNVMPMDISQDNVADEMHVMDSELPILADQHSNTSSDDNTKEDATKSANGYSDPVIKHVCIKANNIIETKSTVDQIETSNIGTERDVIVIDDSDSDMEKEIKNIQFVPKNNGDMKKTGTIISDIVLVDPNITKAVNSELVLTLDADNDNVENSNDNTKCQISETDQNPNCKNHTLTECEVNTKEIIINSGGLVQEEQTADNAELQNALFTESNSESEKTSIDGKKEKSDDDIQSKCKSTSSESKMETNDETKSEAAIQQDKNENGKPIVAENNNSKTPEKSPNAKSTETVASKQCSPNSVTVNAQSKICPPENNENDDKLETKSDAKPNQLSSNLYSDKFIRKLGCRLNDILGKRYTITELIHHGKFSKIYSCEDPQQLNFAIKVIRNSYDGVQQGLEKLNMLMKLQNGVPEQNLNCVRFLEGFSVYGQWCFLMEYYPRNLKEALFENKKSFHIDLVQVLSRQLVSAVTILRNNNIIHSDIKPSHILINASKTRLKLCGFDQSFYFDGSKLLPNTGTCNYRAPELILGYPAGYGIDVWSTALVMYEMATNGKLFPGIFNNDILFKQLCTLGSIDMDMLMGSMYRNKHFMQTSFARIVNSSGQRIIINEITGNDRINNTLFQTYATEWTKQRSRASIREDKAKLCAFSKLLHSMLAMHPKYRIAIEFVFANPFIYETFDNYN